MARKGAGIMIIEKYNNENVITLFGKKNNNTYADLGGVVDDPENYYETAFREAREESGNLIYITPSQLKKYGVPIKLQKYRCYLMYITNLSTKDYYDNMSHIFKHCVDYSCHTWKETNDVVRFPINQFINNNTKVNSYVDTNKIKHKIRTRTIEIINQNIDKIQKMVKNPPIQLTRRRAVKTSIKCLNNTISYQIKN